MVKISLKYGAILGIVTLICTLVVSSLNVIVAPIIKARTEQKVIDNLQMIFGDAKFEPEDITEKMDLDESEVFDALYEITLEDGLLNYVYEMSPEGRNNEILFLIAYNTTGDVLKIQYVMMRETKGRGDKITKDDYLERIYSQNASNMNVEMITGATYSSKAMKQSIESSSLHLISEVLN